jgi:hypothetical protein
MTVPVDAQVIGTQRDARTDVRTVTKPQPVTCVRCREGVHDHRHLVIPRLFAAGFHRHLVKITTATECQLQLQQSGRIKWLALQESHIAADKFVIKNILLDGYHSEVITRPGIEVQFNAGLMPLRDYTQH